ncbi:MAG: glycosyltransferase [Planctomycetia bacterium]|nr:glycosyltransferase [Planctomycetia bacterium]
MRIAHFGTFDVANFGDLLFPLILELRVRAQVTSPTEIEFVHFSPLGGEPVWMDARRTIPVRERFEHGRFDAVVLGGGHLVHALPTQLSAYQSRPWLAETAYAELWLGAAQLAARDAAPLIWNAPGVPRPLDGRAAELLRGATGRVDYLAVRDETSAVHLRASGVKTTIHVVPDTALDVNALWSDAQLDDAYRTLLAECDPATRTIAVHVKERYLRESIESLGARLDQLCEARQATALLLALGPCHGDDELARRVASSMRTRPIVVDGPNQFLAIVAALARCECYLGSSLHGLITAIAFGRPAVCVATEERSGPRKFSGFLRQIGAEHCLATSWKAACTAAKIATAVDLTAAREMLASHWNRVGEVLTAKHQRDPNAQIDIPSQCCGEATPNDAQLTILRSQVEMAARSAGRLDRSDAALTKALKREQRLTTRLAEREHRLKQLTAREQLAAQRLRDTQHKLQRAERDANALSCWLEQLRCGIDALLATRRWRVGNLLGNAISVWRRDRSAPLVTELFRDVFRQHEQWRASRHDAASSATLRDALPALDRSKFASIVIPVHNAASCVAECLKSLATHTDARHEMLLVDDASDDDCASLLSEFAAQRANTVLLRNDERQGYTRAANRGWRAARGDYVVLLNSDTVATPRWMGRLLVCLESHPDIGLAGPVSNAASWQSVPERFAANGDWAVNALLEHWNANDVAETLACVAERAYPRVPLLNGFCLAMKRAVWETIGHFDDAAFPDGYGEETDYCLRAAAAGFQLAVAHDAYVYHAKSQSYGNAKRRELTARGQVALRRKHGATAIASAVEYLRIEPTLAVLRERVRQAIANRIAAGTSLATKRLPSVLFLLPVRGGGGGAHSVVQEAMGMRQLGARAVVAIEERFADEFRRQYPRWFADGLFFTYRERSELIEFAGAFDVAVATVYFSLRDLRRIVQAHPAILPAYYVQDYEPRFFARYSRHWREARRSYGCLPGLVHFAKTSWIRDEVQRRHGVEVHPVSASLDHAVYFPADRATGDGPLRIAAMIRPGTPYRGAVRTLRVLRRLQLRNDRIEMHYFGASAEECANLAAQSNANERWHGPLTREQVADLLRRCDICVDFSDYQAFGRTGLEAMACGAAVVLPSEGGVREYAVPEENALIVDTRDESACLAVVERLLEDHELRAKLSAAGVRTARNYSIESAARSELTLFERLLDKRPSRAAARTVMSTRPAIPTTRRADVLRVHAVLPRSASGWPGSAYLRVLLPLRHPTLQDRIELSYGAAAASTPTDAEVVLVQRTGIADLSQAKAVIDSCRRRGQRLVVELDDDLWAMPSQHPERRRYRRLLPALDYLLKSADAVSVPTEELARSLESRTSRVEIIPNAVDEQLWFTPGRDHRDVGSHSPLRMLLMGTRTHAEDLEIVAPAARRLLREFGDRVRFEVIGCVALGHRSDWFRKLRIPSARCEYPAFVRWLRRRARWQIGLAPLRDCPFNAAKSAIKFLDYSALGLAGVYSDAPAYSGTVRQLETGILTGDSADSWFDAIRTLVLNEELRRALSKAAAEDVRRKHALANTTGRWLAVLGGSVDRAASDADPLPEPIRAGGA